MSVCLIAIFKNESHILKEWIDHYISQGVDRFLMIDNDSDDNYIDILQPYIDKSFVDLVIDRRKHIQIPSINEHFLQKCKQYDWAIICDLDEFIYARKGYDTIKSYLDDIYNIMPSVTEVFIPWKMFGSNGYNTIDKPQPSSVIQTFTKRTNYDNPPEQCVGVIFHKNKKNSAYKTIVRTNTLLKILIHQHETTRKCHISTYGLINKSEENLNEISEHILEESFLHMNHYAIQSKDWFMRVKATRGAADLPYNVRNESYFHDYDRLSNFIDDLELRDMVLARTP